MNGRGTVAWVNIDNYIWNVELIRNTCKKDVMPVVKADAYGHGNIELSKAAQNQGYSKFAVAFISEAADLIKNGLTSQILVFGYCEPYELKNYIEFSDYIVPTIFSAHFIEQAYSLLGKDIRKFVFDIKYNTGMSRVGLNDYEIDSVIELIKKYNLRIRGFYSHYATADDLDDFVLIQYEKYLKMLDYITSKGINISLRHMSNSAAAMFFPQNSLDIVRPGIATYGLQPSSKKYISGLKPVMEIKSKIIKLNTVEKGETVGYSRTYTAKEKLQTAIIPVGYADGYFRSLSNRGRVLINGEYCNIIGRISMDQMTVDVTGKNVTYDDEVVLIGQSKNNFISADELADICATINYEITSKITSRIKRKYIKGGVIFE